MDLLDQSNADIIALQEVAPWILRVLDAQQWTRQYTRVAHHGRPVAPGGLHVMSRFPIKRASYKALPSRQGRGVLTVHLTANGRQLVVATVHLESPLTSTDKAARVKQMGLIWPLLAGAHDAVLMGDMNFGDRDQLETAALDKRFVDLWPVLKPKRPGFTWNMEVNPMAREGAFPGEKSRRLDRILLRSKFYRPASIKIIGSKPVSPKLPNLYPSDHFGLVCDLLIRQKDS